MGAGIMAKGLHTIRPLFVRATILYSGEYASALFALDVPREYDILARQAHQVIVVPTHVRYTLTILA